MAWIIKGKLAAYDYRPKRPPRKKRAVTPAKLRPLKGPVIRLSEASKLEGSGGRAARRAIVEPKRKRTSVFGQAPDLTKQELQQRGDAADALWRELVRRAALRDGE